MGKFSFLPSYQTLTGKVLINLVTVALIPFLVISSVVYYFMYQRIMREYEVTVSEEMAECVELINRDLARYVGKSIFILNNSELVGLLVKRDFGHNMEDMVRFQRNMDTLLIDVYSPVDNIKPLMFYVEGFDGFQSRYVKPMEEIDDNKLLGVIREARKTEIIWKPYLTAYGKNGFITFYKKADIVKNKLMALEVNVPLMNIEYYMDSVNIPEGAYIIYHNAHGNIIYGRDDGKKLLDRFHSESIEKDFLLIKSATKTLDGGDITVAIPRRLIREEYRIVLFFITLGLIVLVAIITAVALVTSKKITRSFNDFLNFIRDNDDMVLKDKLAKMNPKDEVAIIKQKFVDILKRMNDTYKDLIEAKHQNTLLQVELLQARINPHLLYNSLSVIKWHALRNQDQKTVDLVNAMTRYYRIALNEGEHVIKVSDEIDLIREYINIVNHNNSSHYEVQVELDQEVRDSYILMHFLQPVVENSVFHGLRKMKEGIITIRGYLADNRDIIFEVEDNGCGMDQDTVKRLLSMSYASRGRRGYGIKNVIKRINIYYGSGYGIDIKSKPGQGTLVTIKVKLLNNEDVKELTPSIKE